LNDWNDYSCGVKVIFMEALKRLELCRTDERLWLSIATKKEGSLMTGAFLNMLV